MDNNYIKFVVSQCDYSEEEFLKLFNSLPDAIKNASDLEFIRDSLSDSFVDFFDKYIVEKYSSYGYVDDMDINNKEISLWDIESVEELENIKKNIGDWTITNEEEILDHIENIDEDSKEDKAKQDIIILLRDLNLEQLTNIINYIKSLKYDD